MPTAGASGMTEPSTLDWDAPEFDEEPSTTSVSSAIGGIFGDSLAQKASTSSSNAMLLPAAASSPMPDKAGIAGVGGTLLLGSSLGTLPGTAAAPLPATALPASDASGLTSAAAMPSVPEQEKAGADNSQPFALPQPGVPHSAHGGNGKQPGSGLSLGIFGAVQPSGAAALQTQQAQPPPAVPLLPTQHAQPPSTLPGTVFGQQVPEQVGGFAAGAPQAQPRKMVRAKRFSRK
ncbi:g10371 [Coccomyxa elongata]